MRLLIIGLLVIAAFSTWHKGTGTVYWDCNGMSCMARAVPWQKWPDNPHYFARRQHAPIKPINSVYGEKLWATFAASDTLGELMGPHRNDTLGEGSDTHMGCGKCVLVKNLYSKNPDMTALLMKTNRCPDDNESCLNNLHVDLAVPTFDNLGHSLANVCGTTVDGGEVVDTCFATQADSDTGGFDNNEVYSACNTTDSKLNLGCQLFKEWGWTSGKTELEIKVVECPVEYIDYMKTADPELYNSCLQTGETFTPDPTLNTTVPEITHKCFSGSSGCLEGENPRSSFYCNQREEWCGNCGGQWCPDGLSAPPTNPPGRPSHGCFKSQCGCDDGQYDTSWCRDDNVLLSSSYCQGSLSNCETDCGHIWCPIPDRFFPPVDPPPVEPPTRHGCFKRQCGCWDGQYDTSWCKDSNVQLSSEYCNGNQDHCETDCEHVWCPIPSHFP